MHARTTAIANRDPRDPHEGPLELPWPPKSLLPLMLLVSQAPTAQGTSCITTRLTKQDMHALEDSVGLI